MTIAIERRDGSVGVSNGTSTKVAFDRWFRYPAGLSQDALARLFVEERNPERGSVADPFCGAATVGTRAAKRGLSFIGVEAHPEIAELAGLKLRSVEDPRLLARLGAEVVARALTFDGATSEQSLVERCFSPDVLKSLVGLRAEIQSMEVPEAMYLKWALLATLRDVANVKVGWPYLRPELTRVPPHKDVAARFLARLEWMVQDLEAREDPPSSWVIEGDSGDPESWRRLGGLTPDRASVCLTSPPYLNNFDYADATRLELYFWGRSSSWSEMVADVRAEMLIATTQQSSMGGAEGATKALEQLPETSSAVKALVEKLEVERKSRRAGKQYDRVLPEYMIGISKVLEQLRDNLQPGSWMGWVVGDSAPYGIYVDTPGLIQGAALELGFTDPASETIRSRGLRWPSNTTRHNVGLNERIIWMRSPNT